MRRSSWSSRFSIHKSAVWLQIWPFLLMTQMMSQTHQPCFGERVALEIKWVDGWWCCLLKFWQVFLFPDLPKSELVMLCKWGVVANQEEEPVVGSCKIPAASQKCGGHCKVAFTLCCSTHFKMSSTFSYSSVLGSCLPQCCHVSSLCSMWC